MTRRSSRGSCGKRASYRLVQGEDGRERVVQTGRARPRAIEEGYQTAIVNQLLPFEIKSKGQYFRFFAVPNGGKRHIGVARKMKAQGQRAGVPDLVFLFPARTDENEDYSPAYAVFIELKAGANNLDENQTEWRDWLQDSGFDYHLVKAKSVQDAIDQVFVILRAHGVPI